MKRLLLLCLPMLMTSCSPMQVVKPNTVNGGASAKVMVYREKAFNSSSFTMYFGEPNKYYLALENSEYGEFTVAPGSYKFVATNRGSKDLKIDAVLMPNSTTCFKAYANPANYAKMLVPLLMNLTSAFRAEPVACPDSKLLSSFSKVPKA